ncbi:MAG: DUF1289 domain-containing protein [Pseudomonadota bacterium]
MICRLPVCGQVCVGCGRTLEEITGWWSFPVSRKIQVIDDATQRIKEWLHHGASKSFLGRRDIGQEPLGACLCAELAKPAHFCRYREGV